MLRLLAIASILLGIIASLVIAADILAGRRQKMAIMNLVWPLTGLYGGPLALWAYFTLGRSGHRQHDNSSEKPISWRSVVKATTHCGSGCTLGDLIAEWFVVAVPIHLFGSKIFGTWAIDFALAFAIGLAFQYFSIKPMRNLSPGQAVVAALKADTLSLISWQVGMYGWMAFVLFVLWQHEPSKTDPVFWFMMQIAMLLGFVLAYPVNWWLLRVGVKEAM